MVFSSSSSLVLTWKENGVFFICNSPKIYFLRKLKKNYMKDSLISKTLLIKL